MHKYDKQTKVYQKIYHDQEYDFDMPDLKITNGKIVMGKKILVLGMGTCRDTRYLSKENKVWGIDSSREAVKIAIKYGIKGSVADLSKKIKFKSNSFDIIIAKDILEHIANPLDLLKEIRRLLRPDGYAVINVPNHFYWGLRFRILFGRNLIWKTLGHDHTKLFNEWDYMHVRFFTWNGFNKFLKAGGFKIIKNFWDFGTLSHYSQPEMVFEYIKQKGVNSLYIRLMGIIWQLYNFLFPRNIRSQIVEISPSFLSASFYVWCRKVNNRDTNRNIAK